MTGALLAATTRFPRETVHLRLAHHLFPTLPAELNVHKVVHVR
jgi:hypothetical protein